MEIKADVKKDQFGLEDINDFFDEHNESTKTQKETETGKDQGDSASVADTTSDRNALIANIRRLSSKRKSSISPEIDSNQLSEQGNLSPPRTPPTLAHGGNVDEAMNYPVEDASHADDSDSEDVELVTKKGQKAVAKTRHKIPSLLERSDAAAAAAALSKKSIFALNTKSSRALSQMTGTATPDNGGLFGKSGIIRVKSFDKTDSANASGKSIFGDSLSVPETSPPKSKRTRSPRKAKTIIVPAEEADRSAALVIKTREFARSASPESLIDGTRKKPHVEQFENSSGESKEKNNKKKDSSNSNSKTLSKENEVDFQSPEPDISFGNPTNNINQSTPVLSKKHLMNFSDEIDAEIADFKKSRLFGSQDTDISRAGEIKSAGSNHGVHQPLRLNNSTSNGPPGNFLYSTFKLDTNNSQTTSTTQPVDHLRRASKNQDKEHTKPRVFEFPNSTRNRRNRFQSGPSSGRPFSDHGITSRPGTAVRLGSSNLPRKKEDGAHRTHDSLHGRYDSEDLDYDFNSRSTRDDNGMVAGSNHLDDYDPYTEYSLKEHKYGTRRTTHGSYDRARGPSGWQANNREFQRGSETVDYDDSIISGTHNGVSVDYKATVLDYLTGYQVVRRIAWAKGAPVFRPSGNSEYSVATLFDEDSHFIASGMLSIRPNGYKPARSAKQNTYMFYVISGIIEVNVSGHAFALDEGASFQVPRGNSYSIRNRSGSRPATLFFTHGRDRNVETQKGVYDI